MSEESKKSAEKTANTQAANSNPSPASTPHEAGSQQVIGEGSAKLGNAPVGASGVPVSMQSPTAPASPAAPGTPTSATGSPSAEKAAEKASETPRDKTDIEKKDSATSEAKAQAAATSGVEMFTVTVDGLSVEVPKGTAVIEACFRAGADVPYFCYHPRLESVGACRMCVAAVELEQFGARRTAIMTTCNLQVQNGMVVKTGTPDVKKAQNGILEFLLANHPLDCPICDRGGECPLQNMTIAYGPPTSRFIEEKRHFPKAVPLSDFVILDRERCIQCMRCTRFTDEIAGDGQLDLLDRGAESKIAVFSDTKFTSNFSGNTIEICPVGALTSRTYRFAGRPWEIKSVDSICAECGNGCNIAVQHRMGEVVRINGRTNEDINEEWTCDRGKFGQYYINSDKRLSSPLIRREGRFVESTWEEAFRMIADRLSQIKAQYGAGSIAGIGSTRCTLEENYLLGRVIRGVIGTNHLDHQMSSYPLLPMQTTIAEIENFKTIVSVGMELQREQPIVYLRVHKAKRRKGANWIEVASLDSGVEAILRQVGAEAVLLLPHHLQASELERAFAFCQETGTKFNLLLPDANSWGAPAAGILPNTLPGMRPFADGRADVERMWGVKLSDAPGKAAGDIFASAAKGEIKAIYVMGNDPAKEFADPSQARRGLESAAFVVVQDLFLSDTAQFADVVLPSSSFAEKDGTFVNIEGREQKIKQAIAPRGNSRPDWRILADLMARLGTPVPYFSARDIYREYRRASGA